jgi:CRP-like cAMP-binding protein
MRSLETNPLRSPTIRSTSGSSGDASEALRTEARSFFEEAVLTEDLDREELSVVVEAAERIEYTSGDVLLEEGDTSPALYFLASGTVEVLKQDDEGAHRFAIATLETGDFFGEMSFVDDEPASATVRADGDVQVWRLR